MAALNALKDIVQKKKEQLAVAQYARSLDELKSMVQGCAPVRPFREAINKPKTISLIAEIKRASPSMGVIRENFDPVAIANAYQTVGVQAISVLTESDFFQGQLEHLSAVRGAVDVPLLRKDFIIDPYQVYESRAWGADAILLIADVLTREQLLELMQLADSLGLDYVVEVQDEKQLKKVLNCKVPIIGINNRDLQTLKVDLKITERLFPLVPKDKVVVVESGIQSYQDVLFLKILGVQAILVGTAFMQADDIVRKVETLMGW